MNANLYEGRADGAGGRGRGPRADVDLLVGRGDHPRPARGHGRAPGWPSCCPTASGSPDDRVAGTMAPGRPASDRATSGCRPPSRAGEAHVRRAARVLGVHPRRAGRPGRLARRPRRDPRAGRGRPRRPGGRRLQRHRRPRRRCARWPTPGTATPASWPTRAGSRPGRRTTSAILPVLPPLVQIDHVLVGDSMASLGTDTVDIAGTDHRALVATVAASWTRRWLRDGRRGVLPLVRRLGAARPGRPGRADAPASSGRGGSSAAGRSRRSPASPASTRTSTCRSWPATLPAVPRRTSATRWTLWSNDGGTLRPLNDRSPSRSTCRARSGSAATPRSPWVGRPPDHAGPRRPRGPASAGARHVGAARGRHLGRGRRDPLPATRRSRCTTRPGPAPKDDRDLDGRLAAADRGPAGLAARRRSRPTRCRTTRGCPGCAGWRGRDSSPVGDDGRTMGDLR